MLELSPPHVPLAKLVILLNSATIGSWRTVLIPFRYAVTAAAMEMAVEMHAIGESVTLFSRGAAGPELLAQIRQAAGLGVNIFACPAALTAQGLTAEDMIEEVAGVRGAASLLAAGFEPGARLMVF